MSTIAAPAVSSIQEIEVIDVVRTCIRAAVSVALMYGAFSVFVLFAWQWLAVVLALVAGAFAERVVFKLADERIDTAAQHTADALVAGFGWLRSTFAAKKA